ncbi:hypothetical protein B0H17DRAFT_1009375 [Mycena rosella]|uniref:RNA-binding protein n=1 Tax=Mycena rosella TaxID=1033263 RepID=A0AAD7DLI8_MYCRO|nr:hypothetical protein B0H17DRAFT_1009375 [Mycena rosella]
MAYNREWDQGKQSWAQQQSWNAPNVHPREEDYYAEGKRRKINAGGYEASQSYADTPYDNASYAGRPSDSSQDHIQRGGAGGAFVKKRLQPSEPSPHVIFLGLDPDFTEADLQKYLTSNGCSIETVTIIRERSSGSSKGFGFAQFPTIEHARAFVDPLFPFIQVPPPASHGASATAAFYKALETGLPHNGRRVKIDYSQSATPHEKGRMNRGNLNDGTRDIGNSQAAVLLFRGLDPLSGPQAIHQAMLSSSGPGKEGAKGMKRIILIKDKVTMASFGFAFVEFVDPQSASAVLAATMSPQIHPSGFRISDRPVAASFAHPYSFQPIADLMIRDEACIPSSVSLGGEEGTLVRYWDEGSTIAQLEFQVEEPIQPAAAQAKEKKEKKKTKDIEPALRSVPAPSALPVSDKPVTLNFNKGLGRAGPVPVKAVSLGFSMDDASGDAAAENEADGDKTKASIGKKVAPLIASKKTVNNINKWNQVQEELTNDTSVALPSSALVTYLSWLCPPENWVFFVLIVCPSVQAPSKKPGPSSAPTPSTSSVVSAPPETIPAEEDFEFSDVGALTCLLCARQFKTTDQLKRHNKESDLHKARIPQPYVLSIFKDSANLAFFLFFSFVAGFHFHTRQKNFKDANLREVARQKLAARQVGTSTTDQPKYRDRASERRVLFNQPDAPVPEKDVGTKVGKKRQAEGPPPPPSPPPPPVNPGKDENNVGNKLLKMMGWTEGTGLGTAGEGRVDPISTAVYAQGVGLGASKGKDIAKYTEGSTNYIHLAKDAARERYGK